MFQKYASLEVKEVINGRDGFNARQAARKIVEFDPEFVYVAVRAVSADRPNANGDAFPHDELIRIDPLLNRPVYASFIQKGVYVNHKNTDDPRFAKGVILDARYVTDQPEGKTASNPDRYVELLLGVDRQKDPVFARDVERGIINKFSMGASVQFTKCSVCDNVARRKEEFCNHIAKSKMREVKNAKGEKVLAFERCYGVTYNEISAVSDPADETAQLLARVAKKIGGNSVDPEGAPSHGVVALLNEISTSLKRLEARKNMKRSATNKVAFPGGEEMGTPGAEAPVGDPMSSDLGVEEAPLGEESSTTVEVLRLVTDMIEGALPAEQAVEQISQLIGGEEELPPPGEEAGMPEPGAQDVAPQKFSAAKQRLAALLERKEAKETKMAEEKKTKTEKGQYPEYNVQGDPKQHISKPMKGRPASDFASDAKDYAKMYNISAEFVPAQERTASGWSVLDGEQPMFFVSGGAAFGKHLDGQWNSFASRQYGEALLAAILEEGLEQTMTRVNAVRVEETAKVASEPKAEVKNAAEVSEAEEKVAERLMEAAEAKASELAKEANEEFVLRFVEGMKTAMKLQSKNVLDNPVKAAAWEVLTEAGLDGSLAERVASYDIMDAQVDTLIRKAMEYTEVAAETFAEIQAHAESMPHTKVAAENPEAEEDAVRMALRARASKNATVRTSRQGLAPEAWMKSASVEEESDPLRQAVRAGQTRRMHIPTKGSK